MRCNACLTKQTLVCKTHFNGGNLRFNRMYQFMYNHVHTLLLG